MDFEKWWFMDCHQKTLDIFRFIFWVIVAVCGLLAIIGFIAWLSC